MSQANVEIVRRAKEAFNRRDLDSFLADADPDVVWDWSRAVGPEQGTRRGREEVARFIDSWWDAFDESFRTFKVPRDPECAALLRIRRCAKFVE